MREEVTQPQQPIQSQYFLEEDTFSLLDILLVLAKNLKMIIITPAIFCLIAIFYVLFFTNPTYVSRATFMSSSPGGEKFQMMGLAATFGLAMPNSTVAQWSYTDVIKSRTLARSMLDRKFDTKKYGFQKSLLQILTYGNKKATVGIDTLIERGIYGAQGMIEINTLGSLYELEIFAFEPQLAADVALAVMEELDKHQRGYNFRKTTETREFIEERILAIESELEKAENALRIFRERNRSIFESPQLQLEQERLGRDVAVLTGVFTTLRQQLETAKIEEVKESDYVIILDKPDIPLYPDSPRKKLIIILAGFLGIGSGILVAFIREYTWNSNKEDRKKMRKTKSFFIKSISDFLPSRFRKI